MPVRNRTYERIVQFSFGAIIVLSLLYVVGKYVLQFLVHALHSR